MNCKVMDSITASGLSDDNTTGRLLELPSHSAGRRHLHGKATALAWPPAHMHHHKRSADAKSQQQALGPQCCRRLASPPDATPAGAEHSKHPPN